MLFSNGRTIYKEHKIFSKSYKKKNNNNNNNNNNNKGIYFFQPIWCLLMVETVITGFVKSQII